MYRWVSALVLAVASTAANAQAVTLSYLGNAMSGTSTYLPTGFTAPPSTPPFELPTLPSSPFKGGFTASIVVTGAVSTNDLFIPSYELNLTGTDALGSVNGLGLSATAPGDPTSAIFAVLPDSSTSFCGGVFGSCINLTFSHGAVISATMDIRCCLFGDTPQRWQITSAGDSFSYLWGFMGIGTCQNQVLALPPPGPNPPYTGPTINPCTVIASNATPGLWTTATPPVGPADWLQALEDRVVGVGPGKSLVSKIVLSQTYFAAHDIVTTCAMLDGFNSEVQAQSGIKVNPALATTLIANSTTIEGLIGC